MKYWRGSWLIVKWPSNILTLGANQSAVCLVGSSRTRKKAFEMIGLDVSKYPKPEIRGMDGYYKLEYPVYHGEHTSVYPLFRHDTEVAMYSIPL